MNVLAWPALSPDLNIIENAWGWLSRHLYEGGKQYNNRNELIEAIHATWKSIPMQVIDELYKSLPKRMIEVLKTNGGATKY